MKKRRTEGKNMWCETGSNDLKGRLKDYITYFEGTCEFCLNNMGIQQYLSFIESNLEKTAGYDDETILLLYYDLGVIYYKLDRLDEALDAWEKALGYSLKIGDRVFSAKLKSYMAIYYYEKGDREKSKKLFDEATRVFEALNRYDELALHYINILWYKRYEDDKTEVIDYMDKAFEYVQKSDSVRNGRVYLHLGYIYKTIFNDFLKGVKYLGMAQEFCRRANNIEMESMTLHVLADGYLQLFHYDEALEIYETLKEPRYRNITANLKCMMLANVTGCYLSTGRIEEGLAAIDNMREYIDFAQTNIREEFECVHEWLLATYLLASGGDVRDVESLLTEAEKIYAENKKGFPIDYFDYHLADSWRSFFLIRQDMDRALEYAQKQYECSKSCGKSAQKYSAGKLASLYGLLGNREQAQHYREIESGYADDLAKTDLIPQYDRLFEEFQAHSKERRDAEEKAKASAGKYGDPLTGFRNGDFLNELRSKKKGFFASGRDAVICVDIDCSGQYKESYGADELEKCIVRVADIIRRIAADYDENKLTICRIAGDEFVFVLKDTDKFTVRDLAEKVVSEVRAAQIHNNASDVSPYVTVSAGYDLGEPRERINYIMDRASLALHDAKEAGKGKAVSWK